MNNHITFFWDTGLYISTLDDTFTESFASLVSQNGMPDLHDVRPGDFYGNPQFWQPVRSADGEPDAFVPRRPAHEIIHEPVPDTAEAEAESYDEMKARMSAALRTNLRKRKLL